MVEVVLSSIVPAHHTHALDMRGKSRNHTSDELCLKGCCADENPLHNVPFSTLCYPFEEKCRGKSQCISRVAKSGIEVGVAIICIRLKSVGMVLTSVYVRIKIRQSTIT